MEALVTINGHVGGEVEFRLIKEMWPSASFRLACTPRSWKGGAWVDNDTTWLSVNCGRALAEHVKSSLQKGDPVIVVGKLRTSRWQGEAGVWHERMTIEATTVGHDLTRGTTTFRRVNRVLEEAGEIVEQVAAVEPQYSQTQERAEPARSTD